MEKFVITFVACVFITCFVQVNAIGLKRLHKKVKRNIRRTKTLQSYVDNICTTVGSCADIEIIIAKQNELETENESLKSKLNETVKKFETENEDLKQIISDMQNDYVKLESKLDALLAPITNTTTLSPPTSTTTATTTTPTPTPTASCDAWRSFNDHCYLVVRETKNWDEASAYCEIRGSYLLEINSAEEWELVRDELVGEYIGEFFWIGATDREKTGEFDFEKSNLDVPDSYWYSGEPDNPVGDGNCVLLGRMMYDAYLYDTGCGSDRNFICEKP